MLLQYDPFSVVRAAADIRGRRVSGGGLPVRLSRPEGSAPRGACRAICFFMRCFSLSTFSETGLFRNIGIMPRPGKGSFLRKRTFAPPLPFPHGAGPQNFNI